jgi:hypothetical protein
VQIGLSTKENGQGYDFDYMTADEFNLAIVFAQLCESEK